MAQPMQYRGKFIKPDGWTEDEAHQIFSENGWQGSQTTLTHLLHHLVTFKKWQNKHDSLLAHMHVSNFVIEFQMDRVASNGLHVKMLPGIDELLFFSFPYPSGDVSCSLQDDEWQVIDDKPVLRCIVSKVGSDMFEQEDEANVTKLRHFGRDDSMPHQQTTCFQLLLEQWNKIGGQVEYGSTSNPT